MTWALSSPRSSTRCRPLSARSGDRSQAAKVLPSCSSRSTRSVTSTMRGLRISASRASARASITIVSDLPRTLGVPDDAAAALAVLVLLGDPPQNLADSEHLLVARDLAHAAIEHGEGAGHLQQAFGPAQRVERAVLFRRLAADDVGLLVLADFGALEHEIEERRLDRFGEWPLQQRRELRVGDLLLPLRPELRRCAGRRVARLVLVHSQHHLHVGEQARDVLVALVAHRLGDRLRHLLARRLALDRRRTECR